MARSFEGDPDAIAKILQARIRNKLERIGNVDDQTLKIAFNRIGDHIVTQAKLNIRKQGLIDNGHLLDSIRNRFVAKGIMAIGSFGIPYARIHEFGYHGPQPVRQHERTQTMAFGRPMEPRRVNVSAHTREQNIPARPYLAPAISSSRKKAIDILTKVVGELLGGN